MACARAETDASKPAGGASEPGEKPVGAVAGGAAAGAGAVLELLADAPVPTITPVALLLFVELLELLLLLLLLDDVTTGSWLFVLA